MSQNKIVVVGLGFVGLPLALSFSMRGADVYGMDVNERLVGEVNSGHTHHTETYGTKTIQTILNEELESGRFRAYSKWDELPEDTYAYIVTVGIPTNQGVPNKTYIIGAAEAIAKRLKKGDTVIIRSTVIPGSTNELIRPILEKTGLVAGKDFSLVFASERIAEGRAFDEFENMPLVIGGYTPACAEQAKKVLSIVTKAQIHFGSSMEVVETSKVVENVQRDVNIAMVQEFARFAEAMGLDTFELIKLANTHERVNLLTPGPGVGGYCIPNAYHYIKPKADEVMSEPLLVLQTSRRVNEKLPNIMVDMIGSTLKSVGKDLATSKIAIFGLAMKDFSNDDRISPAIEICNLLVQKGVNFTAYDPIVPTVYDYKVSTPEECVKDADALVFLVEQPGMRELDYTALQALMNDKAVVFDAKNLSTVVDVSSFEKVAKI